MARILIAGTGSGCGKTTVTLALLSALKRRGTSVCSFKCGPDYIDPMFHKRVLGLPAFNLDPFFLDGNGLRRLLSEGAKDSSLSVIEGVMGYYDGVANTTEGSSFTVSQCTDTPVILVVSCKGVANSVGAIMSGFKNYVPDSGIRGVIFNHLSAARYPDMADVARRAGLLPLGHLPASPEYRLGSRHLGLVTAGELKDLNTLIDKLGAKAEETLDIGGIIKLASEAKLLQAGFSGHKPLTCLYTHYIRGVVKGAQHNILPYGVHYLVIYHHRLGEMPSAVENSVPYCIHLVHGFYNAIFFVKQGFAYKFHGSGMIFHGFFDLKFALFVINLMGKHGTFDTDPFG